jgi:hypothetical protein
VQKACTPFILALLRVQCNCVALKHVGHVIRPLLVLSPSGVSALQPPPYTSPRRSTVTTGLSLANPWLGTSGSHRASINRRSRNSDGSADTSRTRACTRARWQPHRVMRVATVQLLKLALCGLRIYISRGAQGDGRKEHALSSNASGSRRQVWCECNRQRNRGHDGWECGSRFDRRR